MDKKLYSLQTPNIKFHQHPINIVRNENMHKDRHELPYMSYIHALYAKNT